MADPKDKGDATAAPKPPSPAVPSIPKLTPAVPEPVGTLQATPAPAPPPPKPPLSSPTPPAVPKLPPVLRPPARPPAVPPGSSPTPPPQPAARKTGSFPAVPTIAPVLPHTPATPVPQVAPAPLAPATPPTAAPSAEPEDEQAALERLFRDLDGLDYFQVMGLETAAAVDDIKRAFRQLSRTYHPDRFFHSADETLRSRVHAVYKRVTEAYFVLRDDTRRRKYLADVTGPERATKLRFDEVAEKETQAATKKQAEEQIGTHPKGRQLYAAGVAELEREQYAAAERTLKMALTYEPQNALYKEKLALAQEKLYEASRGNTFKIT